MIQYLKALSCMASHPLLNTLFFFNIFPLEICPPKIKAIFFLKSEAVSHHSQYLPIGCVHTRLLCTTPGNRLSSEHLLSCCKWKLRDSREHERGAEESASSQQWRARRKICVYAYYKALLNQTWKWAEADWESTNFRQNTPIRSLNSAQNATD